MNNFKILFIISFRIKNFKWVEDNWNGAHVEQPFDPLLFMDIIAPLPHYRISINTTIYWFINIHNSFHNSFMTVFYRTHNVYTSIIYIKCFFFRWHKMKFFQICLSLSCLFLVNWKITVYITLEYYLLLFSPIVE